MFQFDSNTTFRAVKSDEHHAIGPDSSVLLTPTSPNSLLFPKMYQKPKEVSALMVKSFSVNDNIDENIDLLGLHSLIDAPPDSTASILTPITGKKPIKDDFFNFEPEYIELIQGSYYSDNEAVETMDRDFMNYDEINCQSKSLCSSPNIDPWMCLSLQDFTSTKPSNMSYALPPINTITDQFHTSHIISDYITHDVNISGDISSVADNDEFDANIVNNFEYNVSIPVKPNREFKNFWRHDMIGQTEPSTENTFECNQPINLEQAQSAELHKGDDIKDANLNLQCKWRDCFRIFDNQASLVDHIEKVHVEVKKGEDFSCFWLACPRKIKPFNARCK